MLNALTIKARLTLGFGILTLLVVLVSVLSLFELSLSNARLEGFAKGVAQRQQIAQDLQIAAQQRAIAARNLVLLTSASELRSEREVVGKAHAQTTQLLSQLRNVLQGVDGSELEESSRLVDSIAAVESRYGPLALSIVDLAVNGDKEAAIQKMNADCVPLLRSLVDAIHAYVQHESRVGASSLEAAASSYELQRTVSIALCVIASVVALALGFLIQRHLMTVLGAEPAMLGDIAQRVASGDLRRMMANSASSGSVLMSLADMQGNLGGLVGEVRQSSTVITDATEDLSAAVERAAIGISQQKQEVDQVATAIHEMAATVQEVARNADGAAQQATIADTQAQDSAKATHVIVISIQKLAEEISHSVAAMTRLQDESQNIGRVLDVIRSVADQTNLLALNAAIEAARAGEAGRGFAVVADEVRGLAKHTQEATHEISELIVTLQRISTETAGMMQNCRSLADRSVGEVTQAGNAVSNITDMIANIQQMMHQIAAAAEEQSAVAEEISRSVTRVRDATEQSATASEQTARASATLTQLGQTLQEKVNHFQV